MQAMAGCCGAWGWTCALHTIVSAVACNSLLCNSINTELVHQKTLRLIAAQTLVSSSFLLVSPVHRSQVLAGAHRRVSSDTSWTSGTSEL